MTEVKLAQAKYLVVIFGLIWFVGDILQMQNTNLCSLMGKVPRRSVPTSAEFGVNDKRSVFPPNMDWHTCRNDFPGGVKETF